MKVLVEITRLTTTRRADGPTTPSDKLTMRELGQSDNGNFEVEVAGPRVKVMQWLKRNGYDDGSYEIVTQ